jgi:hypothetical protein
VCTRKTTSWEGIFCANFGQPVPGRPVCQRGWCARCYAHKPGTASLVFRAKDANGAEMIVAGEESHYLEARPADHLVCPFECDACQFWKLKFREPQTGDRADDRVMALIRRANLDAFCARAPGTIKKNRASAREGVALGKELGIAMYGPLGPWPPEFDHGMRTALHILAKSEQTGLHEKVVKFSTARRARSAATNIWGASAIAAKESQTWRIANKRAMSTKGPTDSEWFDRFITGMENRLGNRLRQDLAISIQVMLEMMRRFEDDYQEAKVSEKPVRKIAEAATFAVLAYCASLRGWEVTKIVLTYLIEFSAHARDSSVEAGVTPHVAIPMTGKFKLRGNMDQNVLLYVAAETKSGLKPRRWVDRLIEALGEEDVTTGWAFQRSDQTQSTMSDFEDLIFGKLLEIQAARPDLISAELDVTEVFGLARSFRRGATTQAGNEGVSDQDIDWMNRWRQSLQGDQAKAVSSSMRARYSDDRMMLKKALRFSSAL